MTLVKNSCKTEDRYWMDKEAKGGIHNLIRFCSSDLFLISLGSIPFYENLSRGVDAITVLQPIQLFYRSLKRNDSL